MIDISEECLLKSLVGKNLRKLWAYAKENAHTPENFSLKINGLVCSKTELTWFTILWVCSFLSIW